MLWDSVVQTLLMFSSFINCHHIYYPHAQTFSTALHHNQARRVLLCSSSSQPLPPSLGPAWEPRTRMSELWKANCNVTYITKKKSHKRNYFNGWIKKKKKTHTHAPCATYNFVAIIIKRYLHGFTNQTTESVTVKFLCAAQNRMNSG